MRIGIPVHVANREASPGLKKGGAVNLVLHTVEVMAPADDIPESITIDLAGMDFHDSVHVSALKLPEGCRPIAGSAQLTVVTIVPPTVMTEETPAAGAVAAPAAGAARLRLEPRLQLEPARPPPGAPAKGAAAPAAAKPAAAKPAAKK